MSKKKKWSRQECRDRYVRGEKIGLRGLVKITGVSFSTLGVWCKQDNWTEQRKQYQDSLATKTDEKVKERTSEYLARDATEINSRYSDTWELYHALVHDGINTFHRLFSSIQFDGQSILSPSDKMKVQFHSSKNISLAIARLGNNLHTAMMAERKICGADYEFLEKAIDVTTRAGLEVTDPNMEQTISYLEQAGCQVIKPTELQK